MRLPGEMNSLIKAGMASVQLKRTLGIVQQSVVHAKQLHMLGERKSLICKSALPGRRFLHEDNKMELYPIAGYPISFSIFFKMTMFWQFRRFMYLWKLPIGSDVTIDEFADATKNAQCFVSQALANEDFDSLHELVTEDVLEKLQSKIEKLSPELKRLIAIKEENVHRYGIVGRAKPKNSTERDDILIEAATIYFPEFFSLETDSEKILAEPKSYFISHYTFRRREETDPWIISRINHSSVVCNIEMLRSSMI